MAFVFYSSTSAELVDILEKTRVECGETSWLLWEEVHCVGMEYVCLRSRHYVIMRASDSL